MMLTQTEIDDLKLKLKTLYNNNMTYCVSHDFEEKQNLLKGDRFLVNILSQITNTMSVLDVGSASGALTFEIAKKAHKTMGIDFSEKTCKYAVYNQKSELKRLQLLEDFNKKDYGSQKVSEVEIFPMDIEQPSFTDKKFDLIVARYVLEYTVLPVKALDSMYQLVKRTGKIILVVQVIPENNFAYLENYSSDQIEDQPPILYDIHYRLIQAWAKQKKLTLYKLGIDYDNHFIQRLTMCLPFLKGSKHLKKYEKHLYLELIKG